MSLSPVRKYKRLSIGVKAPVLAALVTTLLFALFIGKHYLGERHAIEGRLSNRAHLQADLFALTVAQAVWDFNVQYIHSTASALLDDPDIKAVTLRDMEGKEIEHVGTPVQDAMHFSIKTPMHYTLGGVKHDLGELELSISRERAQKVLFEEMRELAVSALTILLVQVLLLSLILRHLLRPVQSITKTMQALAQGDITASIPSQERQDEIGEMARAIQVFKNTAVRAESLAEEIAWRRKLQVELEEAKEAAEAANVAKSQFLANMSHEIRTPLNGIIGVISLLDEREMNNEQRRYFGIIERSGELLLRIVNDILDISKLEAGQVQVESIPFDLKELAEEMSSMVRQTAEGKGVAMMLRYAPDIPTLFISDPTRLRQAVLNLLANAIKFTQSGEVALEVGGHRASGRPGNWDVTIAVRDTGVGIAAEKLPVIFDKFTQADASTTRQYGGTGLGLAITQEISKLLGGGIEVQSTPGKGSVFTLRLSFAEAKNKD